MNFLELLLAFRGVRRAFKRVQVARDAAEIVYTLTQANEIARNAAAYGWEIGRDWSGFYRDHRDFPVELNTSHENPFMNLQNEWKPGADLDG